MDRDITLNYVDKLHAVLLEAGRAVNRALLWLIVLSVICLAVATEAVSIETNLSLAGAVLELSDWMILLTLSWLVGLFHVYLLGVAQHEQTVKRRIIAYYGALGFEPPHPAGEEAHPLEYPNLYGSITAPMLRRGLLASLLNLITFLMIVTSVTLFPIVVEVVAFRRMLQIQNGAWWVWVAYLLLLGLLVGYLILQLQIFSSSPER
jgi:hypothetical protein